MNKTERQLAITLELQRTKLIRAEDLASQFETSVRTIYRDIQALSEAGVPIAGAPGHGYSLMEGYFLPPVSFTAEEAVSLLMGARFIEQRWDAAYGIQAKSAHRKIEAILPENVRKASARVQETMRVLYPAEPDTASHVKTYLNDIRHAILEQRKISFTYVKNLPETDGKRSTQRVVSPYGLSLVREHWMLVAKCDLREDIRHFRLSRMSELAVLKDAFLLPPDFDLNRYQPRDDREEHVLIRAKVEVADKIRELLHFYIDAVHEQREGIHFDFRVRHPEEIMHHLLGLGGDIEVIKPQSLRNRMREIASNILKHY
jgi:predicted DNA-binding transcriptional regulator YafY